MNRRTIVCGLLIASLGLGPMSFAQPPHRNPRDARHDARDRRHDARDARHEAKRAAREERREEHREQRYYYNAREFHRGQRLPPGLRDRQYVVTDWRHHHLRPPPPGHQWVQVGSDYVLVAIATGIIVALILNSQ